MNIQFFNPPVNHYQGVRYMMNPPLNIPILTALCRNAGHTAECVDLEALGYTPETFREAFRKQKDAWPDIVGITALSAQARGAKDLVEAIRTAGYSGKIVVGGVHATIEPEDVFSWAGVDQVVKGECEGNLLEILGYGEPGIYQGEPPEIDDVPAPAWEYMTPKPNQYMGNAPHLDKPEAIVMMTRGCPYQCTFCGNAIFSPQRKRWRPIPHIAAELEALKVYGTRSLFVYDDELLGVKSPNGWYSELADGISDFGYTFKTQGRCSRRYITKDVLTDIHRAGCRAVMWGVETFSPKILKTLGKGTTVEDNWHTLRLARECGIRNFVFTMIGNAEEGDEELAETARALSQAYKEGLVQYRQTTVVTAVPHTKLWDRQHREGWYHEPPDSGPQMHQVYQDTPWLTGERIAYWRNKFDEVCPVGL